MSKRISLVVVCILLTHTTVAAVAKGLINVRNEQKYGKQIDDQEDKYLSILRQAKVLATGTVGEGQMPVEYRAFLKAAARAAKDRDALLEIAGQGSPAGKIYAITLLYSVDHDLALQKLKELADSKEKVSFRSGCETIEVTTGNIAASLLKSGKYCDWTLGAK